MHLDTYEQLAEAMLEPEDDRSSRSLRIDPFVLMERATELQIDNATKDILLWSFPPVSVAPNEIVDPLAVFNTLYRETGQSIEHNIKGLNQAPSSLLHYTLPSKSQQHISHEQRYPDPIISPCRDSIYSYQDARAISRAETKSRYPKNQFTCSFPGCIDKYTGRQKRFRRQEHRKRHENTVHGKDTCSLYKCWVEGCKSRPFTRKDNLKSHLTSVHHLNGGDVLREYLKLKFP